MGRFSAAARLLPDRSGRVLPRPGAPVEVQVMGKASGRGSLDVLRARNVSQTGIGVFVPHAFEGFDLEEEVELVITLPGERSFLARGILKHWTDGGRAGCHFGVHFTEMTRAQRAKVRDFVRRRQREVEKEEVPSPATR